LNVRWPKAPGPLKRQVGLIIAAYGRWWALQILRRVPEQDWPQLRLKIFCFSELIKKRRQNWGLNRDWKGDYLLSEGLNQARDYQQSLEKIQQKNKFRQVIFSSRILKATPGSAGKYAERSILVTESGIYKLDGPKGSFKSMKAGIPFNVVRGVSITPGNDQLVVIHLSTDRDMVVALHCGSIQGVSSWVLSSPNGGAPPDLIGEFITAVAMQCLKTNGVPISVGVTPNIECKLGRKSTSIRVKQDDPAGNPVPMFAKDGPGRLVLTWPATQGATTPSRIITSDNRYDSNNVNGNGNHNSSGNHHLNGNGNINNFNNRNSSKPMGPPPPVPARIQSIHANGNGYRQN
jgi:myosin-1